MSRMMRQAMLAGLTIVFAVVFVADAEAGLFRRGGSSGSGGYIVR